MSCQSNRAGFRLTMSGMIRSLQVGIGYLNDHRLIPEHYRTYRTNRTIGDQTGPYSTLLDHTGACGTILDPTVPFGTIRYHSGPYGTILDFTGPYSTLLDHTGILECHHMGQYWNIRTLNPYGQVISSLWCCFKLFCDQLTD